MKEFFRVFAQRTSQMMGSAWAFTIAIAFVLAWLISGPFFKFSNTWQLVINTSTTIITFLTVFLIQNTQNRDSRALNLKLDEILLSTKKAKNSMIDLEDVSDEELDKIEKKFKAIRKKALRNKKKKTV